MLKEARIVMPDFPLDGHPDPKAHSVLKAALVNTFGGYTASHGTGGWMAPDGRLMMDSVAVYDVAINAERDTSWDNLARIALDVGRKLKQQAVYIRYPDGSVEIADCTPARPGLKDRVVQPDGPMPDPNFEPAAHNRVEGPSWTKRLPQIGDVWRTRAGGLVAVLKHASGRIDGGYNVVLLDNAGMGVSIGYQYVVDLDGRLLRGGVENDSDLVSFARRWAD